MREVSQRKLTDSGTDRLPADRDCWRCRRLDAGPASRHFQSVSPNVLRGLFAACACKLRNAELVTGDHEFKEVEKEIKISWLI